MARPTAPVAPRPIAQIDWSARIADDWRHLDARWDSLTEATPRQFERIVDSYVYGVHTLTAPLLSELTELSAVQLTEWRQALATHAESELALYDTESEAGR